MIMVEQQGCGDWRIHLKHERLVTLARNNLFNTGLSLVQKCLTAILHGRQGWNEITGMEGHVEL